jgi:hypothetical protein
MESKKTVLMNLNLQAAMEMQQLLAQVGQMVKNLPAVQETQVQSQGQEDLLEKGMATDSSILALKIHGQRSLAQVVGIKSFLGF